MTDISEDSPVLISVQAGWGRITLNRPGALHALTLQMCQMMIEALLAWRTDPQVKAVLIDHSGPRGFCAGGDIRMLAESGAEDGAEARDFFFTEYRLNHLLFGYPKTVVTVMDGVTMGGGVGLAMPSRFRVATERTTFAMPETGIGLFPDVGGGWFLPRLPGKAGLWLALTGARIKGADCLALEIATHYVASGDIADLKSALAVDPDGIDQVLTGASQPPGPAPIAAHQAEMDRLFGGGSVETILADLARDGGEWANAQRQALAGKSPQTLKVAFRQLQLGAQASSFAENMAMEYRIGARVVQRHDFLEGVRAVIIDKDNSPVWQPAWVEEVDSALLDQIFAPLPSSEEWTPL